MLKVFSITDLLHLQNIPLPREHMALTTYQSKFVTVGGRHPDTRKLTNKLWTSDTGEHWQASLFPMPTERYDTTAVSIGSSPQYLVVAGGNDSEHILNVVEVLVGEQWNTVDPLPRTLSACQLTLHDENLYLVGRFVMCYTICICKCNSLISSCGDAENSSPTSSALWREFEVSTSFVANASYGQRLISIFSDFTIAAYSSMNQSWVEATSEVNDIEGIGFPTSAVVLPTGELLVYCNIDIAYRVKLSGERYVVFVIVLHYVVIVCIAVCSKLLYYYFLLSSGSKSSLFPPLPSSRASGTSPTPPLVSTVFPTLSPYVCRSTPSACGFHLFHPLPLCLPSLPFPPLVSATSPTSFPCDCCASNPHSL